jgi:hypothetical protein
MAIICDRSVGVAGMGPGGYVRHESSRNDCPVRSANLTLASLALSEVVPATFGPRARSRPSYSAVEI